MKFGINRSVVMVIALTMASFSPSAFAYLDPSTGSMILSAIVGILATLGLAIKTYWYKLKSIFRGQPKESVAAKQSHAEGETPPGDTTA
jgi:hypothetical protein